MWGDIYIYKPIGPRDGDDDNDDQVITAGDIQSQLDWCDGDTVTVHVNCPGGSYFEGLAIFQALNTCEKKVIVKVDLSNNLNYGDGIVLQPDGNILVSAQWVVSDAVNKFAVARFIGGDFPVGVPVNVQQGTIKTFPNPAIDYITIETTTLFSTGDLKIYTDEGEEVLNFPETGCKISVNVSSLATGVYYIKLTGSERAETGRFVKTR